MNDPKYHLRVASSCRLVADNVLSISWCGYVYAEPYGTYDLSIFLRNVAISGALATAWRLGNENGVAWMAGRAVRRSGP